MISISICICTRKRQEGLKRILDSLEKMQIPENNNIKIVIIENDVENYSENIVKKFSAKGKFKICYFLETNQGIAYARNRSIKEAGTCDFCCFVDDDQIVSSDWLVELLKCQREFDADGVWGQNPPIFNKKVPFYISHFHSPKFFDYGAILTYAATNCLLLRKKYLDKFEGPFDIRLNFTGGEDYLLSIKIIKDGGIIRFNPNATAYEIIPNSRTTILYIIKRTYRIANAGYFIQSFSEPGFKRNQAMPRLILRLFYGLLLILPCLIFTKKNKLKGIIKLVSAVGGINALFGKITRFYA